VDLSLGEDQQTLRAAFAEFFDKEATVERVRAAEPLGFDQDLWAKLAGTGAVAMGLPEEAGGCGWCPRARWPRSSSRSTAIA
jgi:alkylation response protein AidB-like acyl-CoA dehydrogenase